MCEAQQQQQNEHDIAHRKLITHKKRIALNNPTLSWLSTECRLTRYNWLYIFCISEHSFYLLHQQNAEITLWCVAIFNAFYCVAHFNQCFWLIFDLNYLDHMGLPVNSNETLLLLNVETSSSSVYRFEHFATNM